MNQNVSKTITTLKQSEAASTKGVASAARQAQADLQRISVHQDVERAAPEEEISIQPDALEPLASRLSSWKSNLGEVIAALNKCKAYTIHSNEGTRMILVGGKEDAQTVRQFYTAVCSQVDRLTVAFGTGKGRTWCNNFRLTAVTEIAQAIREGARQTNEALRAEAVPSPEELSKVEAAISSRARRIDAINNWMRKNHKSLAEAAAPRPSTDSAPVWRPPVIRLVTSERAAPPATYNLWKYGRKNMFTKEERMVIALARKAAADPTCDLLPEEIIGDLLNIIEAAEMRAYDEQEAKRPVANEAQS